MSDSSQDNKAKKGWIAPMIRGAESSVSHKFRISGGAHVGRGEPREPRPIVATGDLGMVSEGLRRQLVERLAARGIAHPRVLAAMLSVPRHHFIEPAFASRAYEDVALPIGHAQTISQPFIVARVSELVLNGRERLQRILEVGTGCGYQAAVLAQLADRVVSVERIRALHELAINNCRSSGLNNLRLVLGDGLLGMPLESPFDGIVVAAAGLEVPSAWLKQLKIGGRIVAPVNQGQGGQRLVVVERVAEDEWQRQFLDAVNFVPLLSGIQ